MPENFDLAFRRTVEPDDRAQQHRLSRSGTAHNPDYFAVSDIEIETVMHGLGAKPIDEAPHADNRFRRAHIFRMEKTIEKAASATMTKKIASTTERVVSRPTLSALRAT